MHLIISLFGCTLRPSFAQLIFGLFALSQSSQTFQMLKFVKMFVPLWVNRQLSLPLRLCKSCWNVKEFTCFYPTQWISGYYHFFLNGGCGSTYIQRRSRGILFKKLWIFRPSLAISFKPPVTPNADSPGVAIVSVISLLTIAFFWISPNVPFSDFNIIVISPTLARRAVLFRLMGRLCASCHHCGLMRPFCPPLPFYSKFRCPFTLSPSLHRTP